jgi:hypothetical protein
VALATVAPMSRTCARPGCSTAAAATLTYDYAGRAAWVENLSIEAHPMSYDLCAEHAGTLKVPHGWTLEDRRLRLAPLPQTLAS